MKRTCSRARSAGVVRAGRFAAAAGAVVALAAALTAGVAAAAAQPQFWMPVGASTTSGRVDSLFHFILIISILFFLLIVTLMTFFVLRYRRRRGRAEAEESTHHSTALELTWSLIPLVLLVIIFALGFKYYLDMAVPPQGALQVTVNAQKWSWSFTYPNGYTDANLHVPVNTPVELTLVSQDVIHSLYVPAFRVKKDVVPGRYNKTWFEATTVGEYVIFCAEYCGRSHSDMLATVVVHEPGGFEKWMDEAANWIDKVTPVEAGQRLYTSLGCIGCHSIDGTARVGPTLQKLFGHEVALKDGSRVLADENYIRESILQPAAKVVAGFEPVMPTYQGRIKDKEITVIIEYLKSLQ